MEEERYTKKFRLICNEKRYEKIVNKLCKQISGILEGWDIETVDEWLWDMNPTIIYTLDASYVKLRRPSQVLNYVPLRGIEG